MGGKAIKPRFSRKILLSAAALASAVALPAPAFASGGGGRYYDRQHYGYSNYRPNRHHRYYNDRRHRGGNLSGGEAALIAAGIIGGVILIDGALDRRNDRDDRRYEDDRYRDRYDDRRYDDRRYDDGRYDNNGRYDNRRYDDRRGAADDDYYYLRSERDYDAENGRFSDRNDDYAVARDDSDIDDILLGDEEIGVAGDASANPGSFANAAFRECVAETRGAAGAGGMNVAMPGAPTGVERLADGSVRMTAQFRASNARGQEWTRRFVCEADDQGVRFLQVD